MDIKIIPEKTEYIPGEKLSGNIVITPNSPIIIQKLNLELVLKEEWKNNKDDYKSKFNKNIQKISNNDINIHKVLNKPENSSIKLEKKNYNFYFQILVPDYLLPSFEYPAEEYKAYLRYSLNVNITSQNKNFSESKFIKINAIPKKDDENNLNMEAKVSVKRWGFFNMGETNFRASYPTKNYSFSEVIPIEIEIHNISCLTVTECKIRFLRRIIFKNIKNFTEEYNEEEELMIETHEIIVKNNEKKKYYYNINLKNIDFSKYTFENPYNNGKQLSDLMPSLNGNIIICQYSVLVKLNYESSVADNYRPRLVMPVYIINKITTNKGEDNFKKIDNSNIENENNTLKVNNIIDDDDLILPTKTLLLYGRETKNEIKIIENMNDNNNNKNNNNNKAMIENKINNNMININYNSNNEINNNDDDDFYDLPSKNTLLRIKNEKEEEKKQNNIINSVNNEKSNSYEQNKENKNNYLMNNNNNNFYPDLNSNNINKNNDDDNDIKLDLSNTMKILLKNDVFEPNLKKKKNK